jgi:hypothetical protein
MVGRHLPEEIRREWHRLREAVKHIIPEYDPDDPDNPFSGYDPHQELADFEEKHDLGPIE